MVLFNSTTYNKTSTAYNLMSPIFIDGSNSIPMSGTQYYNGVFGNVMAGFCVDGLDSILGGNVIMTGDVSCCAGLAVNGNVYIGGNTTFGTSLPTSSLVPSTANQLTNKTYVDTQVATKTTLAIVQSNSSTFTGTNTFNTSLPTSTLVPSTGNQLTNKTYVDTVTSQFGNVVGGITCFVKFGYNLATSYSTGNNLLALGANCLPNVTTANDQIAVGNNLIQGAVSGTFIHIFAFGSYIFNVLTTGTNNLGVGNNVFTALSNASNNVGVGFAVFTSNLTGTYNTAIGSLSGQRVLGSSNTMLGSNTGQASGDTNTYNNSTALGYGSTITASNQIVLGTTSETVSIPGNVNALKLNNTANIKGMACGTSGTTNGTVTVNFGFTFTNTPVVTATANYGGIGYVLSVMVISVNTTSFQYNILKYETAGPAHFEQFSGINWIAIGT